MVELQILLNKLVVAFTFVTFITDHSIKVGLLFLKSKYQVLYVFKHLHASVERQTKNLSMC